MNAETGGQEPNEQENSSAFSPENFQKVMLIQQMRQYDLLLGILAAVDPQRADYLAELHEAGHIFCPDPKFIPYEVVDETEV